MRPPDVTRLAHFVALRKDGTTLEVADQLVAGVVADQSAPIKPEDIQEILKEVHHFPVPIGTIDRAVDRLVSSNDALRTPAGEVRLTAMRAQSVLDRRLQWERLEGSVKEEWRNKITEIVGDLAIPEFESLWVFLSDVLANAFARHGANTIEVIQPGADVPGEAARTETLIQDAAHGSFQDYGLDVLRALVSAFFSGESENRDAYLAWNLTSTFSYYSLFVDKATTAYLKARIETLRVFVDTNFLFGVLDLHESPWNETCRQLVDLCRGHNLPITFHFHEETLQELSDWIEANAAYIKGTRYDSALSKAALNSDMPLFLRQYHEENARKPIDAEAYLMRFNNLQSNLAARGFSIFREPDRDRDPIEVRGRLEAEYEHFLGGRRLARERKYEAIRHDIIVVSAVQRQARPSDQPLGVGAYLLTIDGHLNAFVRDVLTPRYQRPVTIFPGQLMQLIYPMLDLTGGFERGLAAAFKLPMFRAVLMDRGRAQSRILSAARAIDGLHEDQARELLANELLLASVSQAPDDEAVANAVESAMASQNKDLRERLEDMQKATALTVNDLAYERMEAKRRESELAEAKRLIATRDSELASIQAQAAKDQADMEDRLAKVESAMAHRLPPFSALYFSCVGVLAVGVAYFLFTLWRLREQDNGWLFNHPARDSIRILISAVAVGLWAASALLYRRKLAGWILSVAVAGALLALAQLVGRL
jgi:hypothetical protein